ncbi:FGGY family carbohydrate kinase [uncultured Winogradskyella sp.]|uniref:FGGY-family carbohydrate kinase n=1 Tax=uncultured Winogradskyella sp. TaxID=395353 RepID=UPI0030DB369A|tara:strand:- start:75880 stop:77253 length:1374 start_codon:yes stop_codon:yes gene_type:complete
MPQKVTAVFDIGKTNKKFFLFDDKFKEVYKEYASFDEIKDEDGYATEDLEALKSWIKALFNRILKSDEFTIKAINFSTYGASFVHLDENGEVLTPLYNYTKHIDDTLVEDFYKKHGPELEFARTTGSPKSGLLNSGMQLYWIKHTKPLIYKKIKYALHLPQYLSYIFTGIPFSEYTSIGCHTSLWNYETKDYHDWVYKEEIHKVLPPIVSTETSVNMNYNGKRIKIGVGIHDSSSALLPYVRSVKKPFVLVSTGTWSIALNPFTDTPLTTEETQDGCINYMRINGKPVKSSRLFLGNEYKLQVRELAAKFNKPKDYHKTVIFNYDTYFEITRDFEYSFKWKSFKDKNMPLQTNYSYDSFDDAYHQLMIELVRLQVESINRIVNTQSIDRLYVDGGFTDNDLYIKLLSHYLRDMKLRTTKAALGSALGAAIAISDSKLNSKFLKKNYALKKHVPFIIK